MISTFCSASSPILKHLNKHDKAKHFNGKSFMRSFPPIIFSKISGSAYATCCETSITGNGAERFTEASVQPGCLHFTRSSLPLKPAALFVEQHFSTKNLVVAETEPMDCSSYEGDSTYSHHCHVSTGSLSSVFHSPYHFCLK